MRAFAAPGFRIEHIIDDNAASLHSTLYVENLGILGEIGSSGVVKAYH